MEATRETVTKKVDQMFHPNNVSEAIDTLNLYQGPERERVQLVILKLSDGRLDRLRSNTETARQDYRDVLAPAEYPKELQYASKLGSMVTEKAQQAARDEEKKQAIRDEDRRQYLEWLNSGG